MFCTVNSHDYHIIFYITLSYSIDVYDINEKYKDFFFIHPKY